MSIVRKMVKTVDDGNPGSTKREGGKHVLS